MIHKDNYTYDDQVEKAWGDYVEYILDDKFLLIFKDYDQTARFAAETESLVKTLKKNKYIGFAMCDRSNEEPEELQYDQEEEIRGEEKDESLYERFIALKKLKGPRRKDDQLNIQSNGKFQQYIYDESSLYKLLSSLEYMISLTESASSLLKHV